MRKEFMILWFDEGFWDLEFFWFYGFFSFFDNGLEIIIRVFFCKYYGVFCCYLFYCVCFLIYGLVYDVVNCIMFIDYCRVFSKYLIYKELCKFRLIVVLFMVKGGLKFICI